MKSKILLFIALGAMLLTGCSGGAKTSSQSSSGGGHSTRPQESESSEEISESSEEESSEEENLPISSIAISNVQVPVAGETIAPFNTITNNVEGLRIDDYNSYWLEKHNDGSFYFFAHFYENTKQFEGNKIYQIRFSITHKNGFADSVNVTVNSNAATTVEVNEDKDNLFVYYTFPATEASLTQSINIVGATAPVAEETPTFEGLSVAAADVGKYVIGQRVWVVDISGTPYNFFYSASSEDLKFQEGDKYGIKFTIQATGQEFADNVKAYLDGEEADVTSNADGFVTFIYYFDKLEGREQIHEVNISGITAPVVGAKPTIDGITISPSTCKVDTASNTFWCYFTSETGTYFFSHGTEDVQFESGKRYCIKIMIKPKNSTTHHISDKDHILVVKVDGVAPASVDCTNTYIRVQVNFPTL